MCFWLGRCEIGYYGDPMEGKACQQCLCNNHTDDCDDLTGICTHCDGNTHGDRCELCDEGYYGDPTTADCQGAIFLVEICRCMC